MRNELERIKTFIQGLEQDGLDSIEYAEVICCNEMSVGAGTTNTTTCNNSYNDKKCQNPSACANSSNRDGCTNKGNCDGTNNSTMCFTGGTGGTGGSGTHMIGFPGISF